MRRADRVAHVRHRDWDGERHAFVVFSHDLRLFRSRRSKRSRGSKAKSASFAFCTLLVEVTGSWSRNATRPGALKYASRSRHQSWMEIAVSLLTELSLLRITQAMTSSSRTGSGAAITATCATAGCPRS